jgi:hypothetical protein
MKTQESRAKRWIRAWARGWEQFVEATRGQTDRLVGPNPWGETVGRKRQNDG